LEEVELMAKHKKKGDLPTKVCPVCERPFAWRKKWKSCWEQVIYCSERCRGARSKRGPSDDVEVNP
jgi:hypothetical protein